MSAKPVFAYGGQPHFVPAANMPGRDSPAGEGPAGGLPGAGYTSLLQLAAHRVRPAAFDNGDVVRGDHFVRGLRLVFVGHLLSKRARV